MTAAEVVARAHALFRAAPRSVRVIQPLRIRICPIEVLVASVPDGSTVLDIGCGAGLFLGLLAPRIASGNGVDAAPAVIAVAERMRGALPLEQEQRLSFSVAATAGSWPTGRFSVVSLIDVLHHVHPQQQQRVIEEAASRVDAGGVLLFKDIPPRPRWRAFMNRLHDLIMARQWVHYCTGEQVATWLSDAGLTVERRERHDRWWYAHELIIARRGPA